MINKEFLKGKIFNKNELNFIKYLMETNETSQQKIAQDTNTTEPGVWKRMKKLTENKIIGVNYIWNLKPLGYSMKVVLVIQGSTSEIEETKIIMNIEEFKDDIKIITAYLYDSEEERILKEALENKKVLSYSERLL